MSRAARQLLLPFQSGDEFVFEQFVGANNEPAVAALTAIATGKMASWGYLVGATGTGKTHMLMATCRLAQANGRRCGYVTAKILLDSGPDCLQDLSGLELVAMDDFDHVASRPDWSQALFHRMNLWRDASVQLLVSAGEPIRQLTVPFPDLRSRISAMAEIRLAGLTEPDRQDLLRRRASNRNIPLSDDVIEYLLRRESRNPARLIELFDQLTEISLAEKRRLTIPLARKILEARAKEIPS